MRSSRHEAVVKPARTASSVQAVSDLDPARTSSLDHALMIPAHGVLGRARCGSSRPLRASYPPAAGAQTRQPVRTPHHGPGSRALTGLAPSQPAASVGCRGVGGTGGVAVGRQELDGEWVVRREVRGSGGSRTKRWWLIRCDTGDAWSCGECRLTGFMRSEAFVWWESRGLGRGWG